MCMAPSRQKPKSASRQPETKATARNSRQAPEARSNRPDAKNQKPESNGGQAGTQTHRHTDTQAHRQTDRQTDRQTGKQTDRHDTDRQTNRLI